MSIALRKLTLLGLALGLMLLLSLGLGSVYLSPAEVWEGLWQGSDSTHTAIIWKIRLPRLLTALLAGGGLSLSGLLMQSLFRNPIAGPYVLGISSGASLGVAFLILLSGSLPFLAGPFALVLAASLGAGAALAMMLLVAWRLRDLASLLVLGLMLGSFSSAIVMILQYFSQEDALKRFVLWGMGDLSQVGWPSLHWLLGIQLLSFLACFLLIKTLNALQLGEDYARSLGVSVLGSRYAVLVLAALMAGSVTAFCGPIAFVGIAVPHLARLLQGQQHFRILLPTTLLLGMLLLLFCNSLSQLPFLEQALPINAVTALLGSPIVMWMIIQRR